MPERYSGLTSDQALAALRRDGPNVLPEKKKNILIVLAKGLASPVSLMLVAAALLSLFSGNKADFWIILFLFLSNFGISLWHERKADKSIKELQKHLALKARALRDGTWTLVDSAALVEGDVVSLAVGMLVPADISIIESKNLSINEAVLTGESLPKEKSENDTAYSGSFIATGGGVGKVTATGGRTFFGKTVTSIDAAPRRSSLEKDILSISRFISIISIVVVIVLTIALVTTHSPLINVVTLDLSLLIAGIPVALPTVMSLIISIGVLSLAKKQVVVRRLASLEDLANVDLLLSDKTGTLTKNAIEIAGIAALPGFSNDDVVMFAATAVADSYNNPIDRAVADKAKELGLAAYSRIDYVPGDSERKRSTAFVMIGGKKAAVSLGAPRVVSMLCRMDAKGHRDLEASVDRGAKDGYRTLAVAVNREGAEEKDMALVGILYLADSLLPDALSTIEFMKDSGIGVKMLTGDSLEIGSRVAMELGLEGEVYPRTAFDGDQDDLERRLDSAAGFAEVLPKDKYAAVTIARKSHVVAVTGDGVNDLPAIRNADVGFAVSNAVDALKGAADIVLLKNGISVIKDAIIESRKIFIRLYDYSLYRISESFRVIVTIAVIGLIFKTYPLTPVELIVLAFLNDVPIVSLAFDRVKASEKPARIDAKKRFALSSLFGLTGIANSLILLYVMINWLHLPWAMIQTMFFLKLTVSGHMLVYVAHTKETWFKYLPSKQVIIATSVTQAMATALALTGFLVAPISLGLVALVWVWSFFWMQISELMKHQKIIGV